jgi:uncharacterized membrane protein
VPADDTRVANSPAPARAASASRWDLQASDEGTALALLDRQGRATARLFCAAGTSRLTVNVAAFRPIGSEERLSFGSGGEVVTLVADPAGDAERGGVSGAGAVPDNLAALIAGPIAVNYGAQNSGPHRSLPSHLAQAFVAACREGTGRTSEPDQSPARVSACLMQDGEQLSVTPLRAIGTEPFWGARIEGRCVTYSHPEDQDGTRVWTHYTPGPGGGTWSGALGGSRFELSTRSRPGCSDGMSDRVYPIAVELLVGGETRRGCAEPPRSPSG